MSYFYQQRKESFFLNRITIIVKVCFFCFLRLHTDKKLSVGLF